MIELKHVCKTIESGTGGVDALKDVSLTIEDGDVYGIIGMSGAGKSTLVRCINLLERPTSGEVIVNGERLDTMTPAQLRAARREITMILQRTCLRNICFPMELNGVKRADAEKRAMELLELVGLPDKASAYPAQLSGGQQQRVAIARALAMDPEILFFDEPTSALDPELTGEILKVIRQLADEHMTMVIVTHEMSFARDVADRVIFMDGGVIVEQGDPKEVINNPTEERTRQFLSRFAANYQAE